MDYTVYKLIHIIGLTSLFLAMGGMISYSKGSSPSKALIGAFHGIGLILILISGFGLKAKLFIDGFPTWIIAKLVLWLVFGGIIVIAKKGILKGAALWSVMLLLGALAAYIGIMKPFQG